MEGAEREVGAVAEGEEASGARRVGAEGEESAADVAEERRVRRGSLPWVVRSEERWEESVP